MPRERGRRRKWGPHTLPDDETLNFAITALPSFRRQITSESLPYTHPPYSSGSWTEKGQAAFQEKATPRGYRPVSEKGYTVQRAQ